MKFPALLLVIGLIFGINSGQAQLNHDYLHESYDQLHDSPMQQKVSAIAPMPAGVVYIQRPGEGENEIRAHFKKMKELGFNSLKQIMTVPGWTIEQVQLIALEEGLVPWWYGEGGWEPITNELLAQLDIDPDLSMAEIRQHPAMIDYQRNVLKNRVERAIDYIEAYPESGGQAPRSSRSAFDPTIGGRGLDLSEKGKQLFVDWVKQRYETIDSVNHVYNQDHANLAVQEGGAFTDWEDFTQRWELYNHREYRIRRDILRFKADHALENIQQYVTDFHAFDPHAPFRAGGELGLFRPQTWFGVDFEGIADVMTEGGSFYPSMHYSWHFDQVSDEITRPVYMQSATMVDYFKGGWAGCWECTGGPQQFDGEKLGDPFKGFHVDEGTLTQFFLSQIAAGFKGFGIWAWSPRTAGKEAGEYSLLDRHNHVTPRAKAVGAIGKAMQKYRDELWAAHKEPLVGILTSWDSEAIWTAMSIRGREDFRFRQMKARVGISRACINANIPFEYVTLDDIRAGLAPRYPIIYIPAIIAMNRDIMPLLEDYVDQGGRLVLDMPSAWYDEYSELMSTDSTTVFEQIFGATIADYQYAGTNRPYHLNEMAVNGSTGRLLPTHAQVITHFDNGMPAVTEADYGSGSAVILAYEAAHLCFEPGNTQVEATLLAYTLGDLKPFFECEGAIVYRLAAPQADHYFLINEGPATRALMRFEGKKYESGVDAVTGEAISPSNSIDLPAYSGRWIRLE